MELLTGVILLVIGLVACFFGKRYYRLVLALFGFSVGYYTVFRALASQDDLIRIGGAIVAGVVLAFLLWTFYKLAYVLFGALLGLIAGGLLVNAFNLDSTVGLIVVIVLGIVGAMLGGAIADLIIRLATAFGGATHAIGGLASVLVALGITGLPLANPTAETLNTDSAAGIVTLVAVIGLGIAGFLFQTRTQPS